MQPKRYSAGRRSDDGASKVSITDENVKRIRWSMLISHHVPADYDRTWQFGPARVCVRCLGVLLGVVFISLWEGHSNIHILLAMALAVPGVLDFTLHELGLKTSSNLRRLLTGLLFGGFVAALLNSILNIDILQITVFLSWFFLLQITSAILLKRAGRLEPFLDRHRDGCTTCNSTPRTSVILFFRSLGAKEK